VNQLVVDGENILRLWDPGHGRASLRPNRPLKY
jgi:hypothetical protein